MTNKEAKEFLIDISYKFGNMSIEYLSEEDGKKMREAIKILEQEPCEDAISKSAVLDLISDYDLSMGQVVKSIHALPPVTPKQKTGKWIVHVDCEGKTRCCECDQCGYKTGKYTWKNPNFCENCGAKMEGDK